MEQGARVISASVTLRLLNGLSTRGEAVSDAASHAVSSQDLSRLFPFYKTSRQSRVLDAALAERGYRNATRCAESSVALALSRLLHQAYSVRFEEVERYPANLELVAADEQR
jgi:hypothetical protein